METLKMSELREGMVVTAHGMELLLTEGKSWDLDTERPDPQMKAMLEDLGLVPRIFSFVGVIQNLDEVDAAGVVPRSYRRNNEWTLQGNDLVSYNRIR